MNKYFFLYFLLFLGLSACNKQEEGISNEKIIIISSPNGEHLITGYPVRFTAKDGNGADITDQVTFLVNGQVQSGAIISFDQPGTYEITAQLELDGQSITSAAYSVEVSLPRHTTKVMVEDYTGTWCPNCPRVTYRLEQVVNQDPRIIPVAIHYSRFQGDDPFGFDEVTTLTQDYGINAFPSPVVNRTLGFIWDETYASLQTELNKTQALGLAVNSNVSNNTLHIEVKVRFDLNLPDPDLKLVVYLLENGLHADQVNATQYYGGQNPIPDFEQNHTLRKAFTGLYGETIPAGDRQYNQIFTYSFNGNIPADIENIQNCEIVAFVIDETNHPGPMLNAQSAAVGVDQDFD